MVFALDMLSVTETIGSLDLKAGNHNAWLALKASPHIVGNMIHITVIMKNVLNLFETC